MILLTYAEEFSDLPNREAIHHLSKQICATELFKNYQTLSLLGINEQRSTRRFNLMEMGMLQDQVVYDFGCNFGQSSMSSVIAGAKYTLGFEVMDDTFVAGNIKHLTSFNNLEYFQVGFNDPNFDRKNDD